MVETISAEEGNTISSSARISASKRWCFTLNNYNQKEMVDLVEMFKQSDCKYIVGEEVGEQGTPHLQGYIEAKSYIRPIEKFKNKRIHWEKCKGSREDNIKYCKKDGKFITNFDVLIDPFSLLKPYAWQEGILLKIKNKCSNDRVINWYWDSKGCSGKTTLAKHICMNNDRAIYVNGKGTDIKCAIAQMKKEGKELPEIIIFGFPRSSENYVCYGAIEELKDGIFFSGKYESGMIIMNSPHIIVFANFSPDLEKLSRDRWNVNQI